MSMEFRDENPDFRVVMERTIDQAGLEPLFGKNNELKNVVSLNGNISIDGTGTCTIIVNNSDAKAMRRIKNIAKDYTTDRLNTYLKILENCASGAYPTAFTNQYLADVMRGSHNRYTKQGVIKGIKDYSKSILTPELVNCKWVPAFELMAKVWIFFKRFDGTWYHGWTGIISEINIEDQAQEKQQVIIRCLSLWRLIGLSQWISQPSLTPSSRLQTVTERQQRPRRTYSVWTSNLANQKPLTVVKSILQNINITYERQVDGVNEAWWNVSKLGTKFTKNFINGWENENGQLSIQVEEPYPKERYLFIDKKITSRSSVLEIVENNWGLYRNSVDNPATIFRNMVTLTGYDIYLDEIGNFIFQVPQYENLPLPIQDAKTNNTDHLGTKYHGPAYIIGGASVSSFSYRNAESAIVTFVEAPSEGSGYLQGQEAGTQGNALEPYYTGVWSATEETERRYFVRRKRLISVPGVTNQNTLDAYAKSKALELNAEAVTGSVVLVGRPDLQVGRNMFFLEYNILGYITRKSFRYNFGGQVDFTYDWGWGHHPLDEIGMPWIELDGKSNR